MAEEIVQGTTKPEAEAKPEAEQIVESQHAEEQHEYTPVETLAMSQGWKPKEQWEGNPEDHRSAREFLDRGELLSKIKSQSAELRQVQQIVATLSDHNKKVYLAGYQSALKTLQQQKVKALEERESGQVVAIDEQIDNTKQAIRAIQATPNAAQQQTGPTPAFQDFLDKNNWYKEEAVMRHWAHGMAIEFAKVNPRANESDVYEFLEKEVRREFPQKFGRTRGGLPPSPDGDGRQSNSGTPQKGAGSFEKLLNRLPEDLAKTAREMVKRGIVTKEKYVTDYELLESNR